MSDDTTRLDEPTTVESEHAAEHVGRYRIVTPLGMGGSSEVFAACTELGSGSRTWVAIKRVAADTEEDGAALFRSEAQLASLLEHPGLLQVLDYGVEHERAWIATPLVLGETMAGWMRYVDALASPIAVPPLLAATVIASLADALHTAHELTDERGRSLSIVHRDVHPANLLLAFDGTARVIDFGIARCAMPRHRTATGKLRGTLGYIAPERLEGDGVIDRRTDVWGLGATLWEWVAGKRLYEARTLADHREALRRVPALSDHRSDVPLALEEVIAKALSRDPARRQPTARALARELLDACAEERTAFGTGDVAAYLASIAPGLAERQRRLLSSAAARLPREAAPSKSEAPSSRFAAGFALGSALGLGAGAALGAGLRG